MDGQQKKMAVNALKTGDKDEWAQIKKSNSNASGFLDLSNIDLSGAKLLQLDLTKVSFLEANLSGSLIEDCDITEANFKKADLSGAEIRCKSSGKAIFNQANLEGAKLFTEFSLTAAYAKFNSHTKIAGRIENITGAKLNGADLRNCSLESANARIASFLNADLRGVSLHRAHLKDTLWDGTKIDRNTDFYLAIWDGHDSVNDKSDKIVLPLVHRALNWKILRVIDQIKLLNLGIFLFGAVGIATVAITDLNAAIGSTFRPPEVLFSYLKIALLMISGSIIYYWRCPEEIRNFTEAEWVYQLGRPRHIYKSKILQDPLSQFLSSALSGISVCWFAALTVERLSTLLIP